MSDKEIKTEEFNGYGFSEKTHRKKMKFVIIQRGDLDINNAYAFKSKRDLKKFLESENHYQRGVWAVFEVKDITNLT